MTPTADEIQNQEHHGIDRRMLTFFGVLAAFFLAALDQTIVGTALPRIVGELHGFDRYTWVTTVYLLASTAVVPVVGKISEQLGRKRVFLFGISFFLLGSAISGAAQNMDQLIIFRGIQGFGAGVLSGMAFAIIADLFAPAERAKYTGLVAGMFGIASVIGPLVGGYLTDNVSWRAIFYVNLPIGAVVLAVLYFTFPSLHFQGEKARIDYLGALGLSSAAAMLTLAFSLVALNSWSYGPVYVLIVAGILVAAATIWHESHTPAAVLPPQLFRSSIFSLSMGVTFATGLGMFGVIIYIPLLLQGIVGVRATSSGLLLLPLMAGLVVGSIGGGQVMSRTGRYKLQSLLGFTSMLFGFFMLTRLNVSATQFQVWEGIIPIGFGIGISMSVFNVIAQNAVPATMISSSVGALQFIRQMGGVIGLAIIGSVFSQRLNEEIPRHIPARILSSLPASAKSRLLNPEALFSAQSDQVLKSAPPAFQHQLATILPVIREGVKVAMATALNEVFWIGLGVTLVALVLTTFIKEIPLRKTSAMQDRAAARSDTDAHALAI
ncbi:MAG: MDR family MFS transporter [Candidatus Dormibacteria bacterium]